MTVLANIGDLSAFVAQYGLVKGTDDTAEAGRARSFSRPQTRNDEDVKSACRTASNGTVFMELEAGRHNGLGVGDAGFDHSGADMATYNILWFHSRNADQVVRIAQSMPLGQRDKAHRPDYIERTLDKAADQEFEIVAHNLIGSAVVPNKARYRPLIGTAIASNEPIEWRIKFVFVAKGVCAIIGASKSAKSFNGIYAGCAIAEGGDFYGYKANAAPVLYVSLEGNAGFRQRAAAWEAFNGRPFPSNFSAIMEPFALNSEQDIQDLAAICPQGCVVFIDTMARATPGMDENTGKDMGQIIAAASRLQVLIDGLVILVHHTGKDLEKGSRGHSSLPAALDGTIIVSRNGDSRSIKLDKVKDGADGAEHGFRLEVVKIGTDDDGDDISSCVVIPDDANAPNKSERLTPIQEFAFKMFNKAFSETDNPQFIGMKMSVPLSKWREVFYREDTSDNAEAKKKRFQRARSDLVRIGRLTVENDVYSAGPSFPSIADQLGGGTDG